MAFENLGQTFMPRFDGSSSGAGSARLEDILQILSFRIPRILGGRPIAPAELLTSQGAAGDPLGSAIASAVLQQVLQGGPSTGAAAPPMTPSGPMTSGASSIRDMGAPSPLSQFLAPILGPGQANTPADVSSITSTPPRVVVENPSTPPSPGTMSPITQRRQRGGRLA